VVSIPRHRARRFTERSTFASRRTLIAEGTFHMRLRRTLALIGGITIAACSKGGPKGPVVAEGEGFVITAEEFKAKLDEQSPFVRSRYAPLERKKDFLDNLIQFKLLLAEAERRKLASDPEVQETLQRVLVQRLVRQAFDENKPGKEIPAAEVKSYYDAHLSEFQQPERVRVSILALRADAGSPDRVRKSKDAQRAYARLKAEGARNPLAFSNVARDMSDDLTTRTAGGDLGYRTRDELERLWSKEVADGAFALREVGQESAIIEGPGGFFIMKLGGRQPGVNRPYEEAKPQLAARIARERRAKDFDDFVRKLREGAGVKIMDAELDKISVTGAATSSVGAGPPPSPAAGADVHGAAK
jgi:peptidyl-prolyl cis-trans isomerase C